MRENQNNPGMLRPFQARHAPPEKARISRLEDGRLWIFLDPHILIMEEWEWVKLRDRIDLELGLNGLE